jgi:hypothetical protein
MIDPQSREPETMCPMCITTAVLIVGGIASTGGLAALAVRRSATKRAGEEPAAGSGASPPAP